MTNESPPQHVTGNSLLFTNITCSFGVLLKYPRDIYINFISFHLRHIHRDAFNYTFALFQIACFEKKRAEF